MRKTDWPHWTVLLPSFGLYTHVNLMPCTLALLLTLCRCYLNCCDSYCSGVLPILLGPCGVDLLFSYFPLCRRGGGLSTLPTVYPNSCLLSPSSLSPEIFSIVLCVGSLYIPLMTSIYGYAPDSIWGLRGSTVLPDVVVVAISWSWAPVTIQRGCVFDRFYVSQLVVFGSIPIFLLLPHIPWVCGLWCPFLRTLCSFPFPPNWFYVVLCWWAVSHESPHTMQI